MLSEYLAKIRKNKNSTDEPRDRMTPRQLARIIGKPEKPVHRRGEAVDSGDHNRRPFVPSRPGTHAVFKERIRDRHANGFEEWLDQVEKVDIQELKSFARGLRRDLGATATAFSQSWSNGQVEGQIHRLKLLKPSVFVNRKVDHFAN